MRTIGSQGVLSVGSDRLEYRRWGLAPSEAPTLVLLHEGLGSVALWRDFPERLAAATDLGVLAYSRAGYGGSSPCALPLPLDYMEREAAQTVPAVLDQIGFHSGVLVGHSDGASIAALYGGLIHDARVKGLVLMAPHFFTEAEGLASIAAARTAFESGDLRARLARYHGSNVDCAFRGWCGAWLDPGFTHWNIEYALDGIQVPVLAVQGCDDEYGTRRQIEAVTARCGPHAEVLMLEDCGHAPHRDQADRTLAAVAGFATRLLAPAGKQG